MDKLDAVLRSGGTSPQDFTLHDERHSLRVADRIAQLLTGEIHRNLSDYELALLLLAAYGHDVGMTPERNKVQAHYRHLLLPDQSLLSGPEKQQFQKFLDEWQDQPVLPPLSNTSANLDLADELTAFYVRDRHNEWSAEWLREKLVCDQFGGLSNPVEILIRLCSSHHWSFERLRAEDFDPILTTASQPQLVHLRYLACILRLADILENDPERTPKVLYEHRNIDDRKKSLIHWRKDHAFTVDIRENQLHFHARPPDAHVHKALEELADWIDHELNGIASLGDRLPIHNTVGKETISRKWHLAPALTRDIRPFDASYEYIEGAFRPDTARLLQLLSNEQLYGNPLVAVRELLQNAFDAVREKIARKRLEPHIENPADRIWEEQLGNQEQVTLTLKPGTDGEWLLICEDTGVGLTKALITGHLLISGHTRRHAILDLERRCQEKGFRLGRTGQFGIGVLSYFMLADEVEIRTARAKACGDDDGPGWSFTTRGVGSFGELSKLSEFSGCEGGTHIQWRLRPAHITDPTKFSSDLLAYLKKTLIRIPCRLAFRTEGLPGNDLHWQRPFGWVKSEQDWTAILQAGWKNLDDAFQTQDHFLTRERRIKLNEEKSRYPSDLFQASNTLRCEFKEVELPDGEGLARLTLPYFELAKGRSICSHPEIYQHDHFKLRHQNVISWEGIACEANLPTTPDIFGGEDDVDFELPALSLEFNLVHSNKTQLSVNRLTVTLAEGTAEAWLQYLNNIAEPWIDTILRIGSDNFYCDGNLSRLGRPVLFRAGAGWYHHDEDLNFAPIIRPFAISLDYDGVYIPLRISGGQPVPLLIASASEIQKSEANFEIRVVEDSWESGCLKAYLYTPASDSEISTTGVRFPDEWKDVAMIRFDFQGLIVNPINHLVALISDDEKSKLTEYANSHSLSSQLLDNASTAQEAAFALCCVSLYLHTPDINDIFWREYTEENAGHLRHLWTLLAQATGQKFEELRLFTTGEGRDVMLSPTDFDIVDNEDGESILPDVTDLKFMLFEGNLPPVTHSDEDPPF